MNISVLGTDTNIGKTVVAAILCLKTGRKYWKPVQSGLEPQTDSQWVSARLGGENVVPESYVFAHALSPHRAAFLANRQIDADSVLRKIETLDNCVIEGAGGLLVPLNNDVLQIDLFR